MCTPTLLAVSAGGLAIAGGVSSFSGQNQQFKQQRKAAEAHNLRRFENAEAANKNFSTQMERSRRKLDELKKASANDSFNARIEFLKARGAALAAAGSAGVEGVSINDLMADFGATAGRNESVRSANLRNKISALHDNEVDLHAQTISQRNSIAEAAPITPPSPLAAGLQIAGGLLQAGQGFMASKPKTFTPTSTSAGLTIQNNSAGSSILPNGQGGFILPNGNG